MKPYLLPTLWVVWGGYFHCPKQHDTFCSAYAGQMLIGIEQPANRFSFILYHIRRSIRTAIGYAHQFHTSVNLRTQCLVRFLL